MSHPIPSPGLSERDAAALSPRAQEDAPVIQFTITIRGKAAEALRRLARLHNYGKFTRDPCPALDKALIEAWERVPADHPLRWTDAQKARAQRRISHDVKAGKRKPADAFPCVDCGHVCSEGDGKHHEWDHHLGYDREHQRSVEAVCRSCHRKRTHARYVKHGVR